MTGQMCFYLAFSFDHKAQADWISKAPREESQAEGARIPEWIKERRSIPHLFKPLQRPGQVVRLLSRSFFQVVTQTEITRRHRLRRIERLRTNLTNMVDPH